MYMYRVTIVQIIFVSFACPISDPRKANRYQMRENCTPFHISFEARFLFIFPLIFWYIEIHLFSLSFQFPFEKVVYPGFQLGRKRRIERSGGSQ